MIDWNDWRYFLAVARDGSSLGAARTLRVSQTTVARRIAALEDALGVALVDRLQSGFRLTATGEAVLPAVEALEVAAEAAADVAQGQSRTLSGTVRITTEDIYAVDLLGPALRDLRERYPEIMIELDATQAIRDIGKGQADIALRNCTREQLASVVGRKLCEDDWAFYCSIDYAERRGVPESFMALHDHDIVGGGGDSLWQQYRAWLERHGLAGNVVIQQATSTGLFSAVRSGVGVGMLPCIVGETQPTLIRCMPPNLDHGRSLWLLTHERVKNRPSVRAVLDFLYERLHRTIAATDGLRA